MVQTCGQDMVNRTALPGASPDYRLIILRYLLTKYFPNADEPWHIALVSPKLRPSDLSQANMAASLL